MPGYTGKRVAPGSESCERRDIIFINRDIILINRERVNLEIAPK